MAKYRKKPIIVEAEQWDGNHHIDGIIYGRTHYEPYVETLEGDMRVRPGDWIITGVKGERYPIKDEIFKLTYELVTDEDAMS